MCGAHLGRRCRGTATYCIEFHDGGDTHWVTVTPGQVGWDEPSNRIHRAVNVGEQPYEEVTIFLLDHPDAEPQPGED